MSHEAYRDDEQSHEPENDERSRDSENDDDDDDDQDPRVEMFKRIESDRHGVKGDRYNFTDRLHEVKMAIHYGSGRNTFLQDLIKFDPESKKLSRRSKKPDVLKKKYRSLFETALRYDENLLLAKDDDGRTALFVAVSEGKLAFVELICEVGSSGRYSLQESIAMSPDTKTNCIHKAITTNKFQKNPLQKTQCLDLLLRHCDPKTLLLGDPDENRPLHLIMATKYLKSFDTTDSVELLVTKLVNSCDGALKISNKENMTPFQYFILRCKKPFYDRPTETKLSKDPNYQGPTPSTRMQENEPIVSRDLHKSNTGLNRTPVSPTSRMTFSEQTISSKQTSNRGIQRGAEPVAKIRTAPQTVSTAQSPRQKGWDDAQFKDLLVWIETFMKKETLRRFDLSSASVALYGHFAGKRDGLREDERKQLAFNPIGATQSLSAKTVGKYYDFLKFDSMLQFVALPQPPQKQPSLSQARLPSKKDSASIEADTRKTHYPEIFKWLKNRADGKVKSILRIIIEDDLNDPHSDEEIEETLDGIVGIEDWNWRKYDISSSTILKAAKKVKKLHLYTTGNNAVLEGWLASDGLRRLKQLEEVILWVKQPQSAKSNKNIETFQTRLRELIQDDCCKKSIDRNRLTAMVADLSENPVEVDRFIQTLRNEAESGPMSMRGKSFKIVAKNLPLTDTMLDQEIARTFGPGDRGTVHRWLESVKKCRDWVRNVRGEIGMENKKIKVALIDDGVDASHAKLSHNIHHGISFVTPQSGQHNVPSSYYASSSGHGTLMASLITFACPWVELYVAKMNDGSVKHKRAFTATSAAEAVKWAAEHDVDIISMSWTIDNDESVSEALVSLDKALLDADNKNILMFCAARDEGMEKATEQAYPAGGRPKQIFRIGAAAASGVGSTWVNLPAIDYLFPGADLREFWQYSELPHMPAVDGSSSATALASGLTALILSILAMDTTGKWSRAKRTHPRIKSILDSARGDKAYLQVWQLWTDSIKDDDEVDAEVKARSLQDMVTSLINKSN